MIAVLTLNLGGVGQ
ncbi:MULTISPECIES: hypothetical protein [unclassified Caulobacter]|nr:MULTISPECIES: hypothetical protein [unclassified Caulobacter]MCA0358255.1 hypothetical protein [Pseudomonadota bacterium]